MSLSFLDVTSNYVHGTWPTAEEALEHPIFHVMVIPSTTAEEAIEHPFFHAWKRVPINPDERKLDRIDAIPNLELNLWDFSNQSDDCFLGLKLAVNPSDKSLDMIHGVSRGLAEDILFCSAYKKGAEPSGDVLGSPCI